MRPEKDHFLVAEDKKKKIEEYMNMPAASLKKVGSAHGRTT